MAIYKTDKKGRPCAVVAISDKKETGFPKGYFKLKNKLYKVHVSQSNKEGVENWVTITEMPKSNNGGFGGGNNRSNSL